MYRKMDDSYPDNSTNFTTNEQTQEQLQPAVKNPLEHEEEESHTPTGTLTQPRCIKTCSKEPTGGLHTRNNAICETSSVFAKENTNHPSQTVKSELQRFPINPYNGLRNQGATCYLNSVLQCLYMTEDFRREVENFTRDSTNTDEESTALIKELQKLFRMLKKHNGTTKGITQCLGIYNVYAQQDVVEYYQRILYMITPQMSKIFMAGLKTTTNCFFHHKQEQKTPIFCIPLPINSEGSEVFSVAMGMENFSKIDKLGKDNLIYCDGCEQKAEAVTWTEIETFPTILTVNLKRFHCNVHNNLVKNHCPVEVSLQLEFKNHTKYELYAVINHMGGENGGHYNVDIKSFEDNEWYCFDDSYVSKKYRVEESLQRSQQAYLLMYRKMDDSYPDNSTNFTTNISEDLLKQCNPAFKKQKLQTEKIYPIMKKSCDRKRLAMIINNVEFKVKKYNRRGAEKDEDSMRTLLKALDYDVIILNDLSGEGMEAAVRDFSQRNEHKSSDSTFVIIMSHGGPDGINGINYDDNTNDIFPVNKIFHYLNSANCPGLIDKPKIILIQACRGDQEGHVWVPDSVQRKQGEQQHSEKDFACFRSCTPDTVSNRNPVSGSVFIQSLVKIFNEHCHKDHIMELFRKVSEFFEESAKKNNFPYQMPSVGRTTLVKEFYLFPGL